MNTHFNNQNSTKAVAAGVQKGGIMDTPKGKWHKWVSEPFNFFKDLLFRNLLTKSSAFTLSRQTVYFDGSQKVIPNTNSRFFL